MQENKTTQMKEYLKLKQIQENDKSDEIIEEIFLLQKLAFSVVIPYH